MENLFYTTCAWSASDLLLLFTEKGPAAIHFIKYNANDIVANYSRIYTLIPLQNQFNLFLKKLTAYLNGERVEFDDTLDPVIGTPFQKKVWNSVKAIPYGETRTYGQIAGSIGRPKSCRAVGAANGANPLPVVVPCHRVVQSNGNLGGYAGGVVIKDALLRMEQSVL